MKMTKYQNKINCTLLAQSIPESQRYVSKKIFTLKRLNRTKITSNHVAVHYITRGEGPQAIQIILRQMRHHLSIDHDTVSHTYREGNKVTDSLASEGSDQRHYQEYDPLELPRCLRALAQIDRYGPLVLEITSLIFICSFCIESSISPLITSLDMSHLFAFGEFRFTSSFSCSRGLFLYIRLRNPNSHQLSIVASENQLRIC